MREIVALAIGQCGNQVNYNFWDALATEHGIDHDAGTWTGQDDRQIQKSDVYFNEIPGGRFVPRSVLVDLEPGVLGQVQSDQRMGRLFNPDTFVAAQDGAGNNWAKGYFSYGAEIVEDVLDQVRRQTELCESLSAFQIMHSLGGGTGSGLGSLLLERLSEDYSDSLRFNFSILPGSTNGGVSDVVTEPYNSVLAINQLIENSQAVFPIENRALNRICQKNLKIAQPSFKDINHVVAQVMSNTTCTLRFQGCDNNSDIRKLATNLVPFPRIHFLLQAQAPLVGLANAQWEKLGAPEIAAQMFDSRSLLSDSGDLRTSGRILTASCLFRGKDISALEAETSINKLRNKNSGSFVEWIPDNTTTSVCHVPSSFNQLDVSGTFLTNSTSIAQSFRTLSDNFEKMLKAKAYVHWYTQEGMDLADFQEALANVQDLIADYQQYQEAGVGDEEDEDDAMDLDDGVN
jgi:tubulin beta